MAWGARREHSSASGVWNQWSDFDPLGWAIDMLAVTPRGYTGHEHLDRFGLIHMNGRIYDPASGEIFSRPIRLWRIPGP